MQKLLSEKEWKEENDREMELIYLLAMRAALRNKNVWGYDLLRRATAQYAHFLLLKNRSRFDRLRPAGNWHNIMFIGTNPSVKSNLKNVWEDHFGKQFAVLLEKAGIDPKGIYFTNLYKKPTPENRPLEPKEIESGWRELKLEIAYVDPTIIVPLGKQCQNQFEVGTYELKKWNILYSVFGMPHPSFVNRSTEEKKVEFINQLKEIKKYHDTKRICQETLGRGKDRRPDRGGASEGKQGGRSSGDGQEVPEVESTKIT